jgi:hypothetical protein
MRRVPKNAYQFTQQNPKKVQEKAVHSVEGIRSKMGRDAFPSAHVTDLSMIMRGLTIVVWRARSKVDECPSSLAFDEEK